MSIATPLGGIPGMRTAVSADHRVVFKNFTGQLLPGGKNINGTLSRDPLNTGFTDHLRAGLLMGKVTSTGLYANSILGTVDSAYSSGTSLTVTTACATEIVRRIGSSGTFKIVGPPSAAGINKIETVTYSAVDTSTGIVTVTALSQAYVAGSFILPTDGSEFPITFLPDGWPIKVTNPDGTAQTTPFPVVPIEGCVDSTQLINWPSDTSLRSWIVSNLTTQGVGRYTFSHLM